ncbi:hypothetical protein EG830_10915, partial [bacterium]|nr:hypothetical protein [bacterium]
VMLVGANDGFLHCFVDDDGGNNEGSSPNFQDDTVFEKWCFVPWDIVPNLRYLHVSGEEHHIYIDGSPIIYASGTDMLTTFGLRRGGTGYYTLKIGSASSTSGLMNALSDTPSWKWGISSTFLSAAGGETLGQSWCTPTAGKVKVGGDNIEAVFFSGGYDTAQDEDHYGGGLAPGKTVPNTGDTVGRALFAVNSSSGSLISEINFNHGNTTDMTHSIIDFYAYDNDSDPNNLIDTVYAGDMGGNLFLFNDRSASGSTWSKQLLFIARPTPTTDWLKFMYRPVVKKESWGDFVFIGTGDRETPDDAHTVNYFYGIKNKWDGATLHFNPADTLFKNVTTSTYDSTELADLALTSNKGWYFQLTRPGEKVVSYPIIYPYNNGEQYWVIFTTFTPDPASTIGCNREVFGGARVYMVDYASGKAVQDFDASGTITNADRSKYLGMGMPSPPQMVRLKQPDGSVIDKLIVTSADHPSGSGSNPDDLVAKFDTGPGYSSSNTLIIRYWKQR